MTGFVSVKVISVMIGPSGVALLGQLNNFSSIILAFGSGGINSGITKYVAELKNNQEKVKSYIGTGTFVTLASTLLFGFSLIIFSNKLSFCILLTAKYSYVFTVFGTTLIFYTFNAFLLSILNGFQQFRLFVIISIFSSIFGLLISICLVCLWGIDGALINSVTSQSFLLFITIYFIRKHNFEWLSKSYLLHKFQISIAIKYFNFFVMTLAASLGAPVAQLLIRSYLMKSFSMKDAGCWEGINKVSNMYLMVITSSFGIYYLPRLSELKESLLIKKEIYSAFKIVIPCLLGFLPLIFLFRNQIISILFSNEFRSMNQLFAWQLVGDFLKISSWLIAYLMLAKAMMKQFVITEISFSISYICFVFLFCNLFGFQGVVIGYSLNYFIYLITIYFLIFRNIHKIAYKETKPEKSPYDWKESVT